MKKIVSFILISVMMSICTISVFAQKIAVKSDIKAYIDYTPIRSYNIDGYTYVIAEELRNYGFDVMWNNDERTLKINRNELTTPIYTKELFDADSDPVSSSYLIYPTDIKTYLNDIEANSFNIGGQTVIQIDELSRCGNFEWDAENREVKVMIYEAELQNLYEQAENKVLVDLSEDLKVNYDGQVDENGIPNGIGILKEKQTFQSSFQKEDEILGFFENGKPYGKISLKRFMWCGRDGQMIQAKFLGEINAFREVERSYSLNDKFGYIENVIRENNFGKVAVPYNYIKSRVDSEVFADGRLYLNGLWFEDNGYQGQKGVTFRSWYDGGNYQSILKTDLDEKRQQIISFEENNQVNASDLLNTN